MSRIGKKPVAITSGVKVNLQGDTVLVEGKLGKLDFQKHPLIDVAVEDNEVVVTRHDEERATKALHGTTRSIIANMIQGVSEGFTRSLEISGVGWNAKLQGQKLALNVGYADTRYVEVPQGVTIEVNGPNIKVSGASKQLVGQVAARIRGHRPPEPYNGKGIKYSDETVIRKQGKAFAGK